MGVHGRRRAHPVDAVSSSRSMHAHGSQSPPWCHVAAPAQVHSGVVATDPTLPTARHVAKSRLTVVAGHRARSPVGSPRALGARRAIGLQRVRVRGRAWRRPSLAGDRLVVLLLPSWWPVRSGELVALSRPPAGSNRLLVKRAQSVIGRAAGIPGGQPPGQHRQPHASDRSTAERSSADRSIGTSRRTARGGCEARPVRRPPGAPRRRPAPSTLPSVATEAADRAARPGQLHPGAAERGPPVAAPAVGAGRDLEPVPEPDRAGPARPRPRSSSRSPRRCGSRPRPSTSRPASSSPASDGATCRARSWPIRTSPRSRSRR